ncbi:hypothetical protein ABZ422_04240 [Micromonospora zamorensis]|uniref:hypothetical protein n=1 Tax=Micromonospora zamorensis TaxID=709883 RepID=UPI00082005C1|nr:hypothetical protein [Micromonospora zamorensis]WTE85605.1 hypothetical protein OHA01_23925 [Micromonospora zamorensis]SCG67788.1 hypothetical protein GA0070619_5629 [Micromonospora zamorensis]
MSEELPIPRQGDRSDGLAVIEWGADDDPAPRRRFGWSLAGLTQDPRVPLLLAGLGAVAGVASMVGEWLVMSLPNGGPEGDATIEVPAGVSEVGGFGIGYLVGLLALVCTVVLALRGTASVRSNARLTGLTLAGALLALLVAATATLNDSGQRTFFYSAQDGFKAEYGRGLIMAFAACVLLGAALRLAPAGTPEDDQPGDAPAARAWRRRRDRDPVQEDGLPAPADLTVTPAAPFARPDTPS